MRNTHTRNDRRIEYILSKISIVLVLAPLAIATSGCGQAKKDVEVMSAPKSVLIAVGGKNSLDVTINRDNLKKTYGVDKNANVTVALGKLPKGVTLNGAKTVELTEVFNKESKKKEPQKSASFALVVGKDTEPGELPVEVSASADGMSTETKKVKLDIKNFQLDGGWIIMILAVGTVLALVSFCLYRVFSLPPVEVEETLQGPTTIDLPDTKDPD